MPKPKTSPISRIDAAVKAFKKRSPCHHSPAFMLGLRAVLAVGESASPVVYCNPYRQRTAKFDAFRAGCTAGNTVHLPPRGLTNFQSWTGE
jgi:hypothetical protein